MNLYDFSLSPDTNIMFCVWSENIKSLKNLLSIWLVFTIWIEYLLALYADSSGYNLISFTDLDQQVRQIRMTALDGG